MQSILHTIKKLVGIDDVDDTSFDTDLIIYINSAISTLTKIGMGPTNGFRITGPDQLWTDFIGESIVDEQVKSYIYLKVKLLFDTPTSQAMINTIKEEIRELECRLVK